MIEHGVPDWFIDSCKKIKYMFPKGHAVAYVTMALRIAWYKVHRPAAYYCAYFTVRADCFDASILGGSLASIRARYKEMDENQKDLTQKDKDLMVIMEPVSYTHLRTVCSMFPARRADARASMWAESWRGCSVSLRMCMCPSRLR